MSQEDIEEAVGTTEAATATEDSGYSEILEGQAEAPIKPEASEESAEKTTPEVDKAPAEDPEVILEIGGKEFTMKQSEAVQVLENHAKIAEREKALTEKEKSLNRDYTQKSQQVAEFKKSFESAFGRVPERNEIQALGKVWKSYFSNPQAKQAIDAIISGNFSAISKGAGTQSGDKEGDTYTSQLEQKIFELEEKLNGFTSTLEERENQKLEGEAKQITSSWKAEKAKAGVKITDEFIKSEMEPFFEALRFKNPDWTGHQILDRAHQLATIGDIEKTAASKVLKSADEAKKGTIPRIKPKSSAKGDSEKTYGEIFLDK